MLRNPLFSVYLHGSLQVNDPGLQSTDQGCSIERPGLFVRPTGVVHLQEDTSEGRNKYVERTKTY